MPDDVIEDKDVDDALDAIFGTDKWKTLSQRKC